MFKKLSISITTLAVAAFAFTGIVDAVTGTISVPTFNTLLGTQSYGNETDWVQIGDTSSNVFGDQHQICNGEEGYIRMYIHNNAATDHNGANNDGVGVATGTTLNVNIPQGFNTTFNVNATVDANNSNPSTDTATFSCPTPVELEYIPGSAVIRTALQNFNPVSDDIVNGGALIGQETNNGVWPGCFDMAGFVFVKVKATAEPVVVSDLLPTGLTATASAASAGTVTGLDWAVGTLASGQTETLVVTTTVNQAGNFTNFAGVSAANETDVDSTPTDGIDGNEDDEDSATITVKEPVVPVNVCTGFTLVDSNKTDDMINAVMNVSTNNDGDITKIVYTIISEDGSKETITVTDGTQVSKMFTEAGVYKLVAEVMFDNGGNDTATCTTELTVEEDVVTVVKPQVLGVTTTTTVTPTTTPVTTPVTNPVVVPNTVKALPNTGAGAAVTGLFGLSAIGASVKGFAISRRNLKESLLDR